MDAVGRFADASIRDESSPPVADAGAAASAAAIAVDPMPDARARDYVHWLPLQTVAVVRVPVSDLRQQPGVEALTRRTIDEYDAVIDPLSTALRVPKEKIRRFTWAATQIAGEPVAANSAQGVAIVELLEPLSPSPAIFEGCRPLDLRLGEGVCHQPPEGAWVHPFVLVDSRTILSGPLALLRELHDRELHDDRPTDRALRDHHPHEKAPAKLASADPGASARSGRPRLGRHRYRERGFAQGATQAILAMDLTAARRISLSPALALLDHWPAGRDDWRTVPICPRPCSCGSRCARSGNRRGAGV